MSKSMWAIKYYTQNVHSATTGTNLLLVLDHPPPFCFQAFCRIFGKKRDLPPFSHESIREMEHVKPGGAVSVPLHPKHDGYRVEVRGLCRAVKSFHNKLGKPFLCGAGFVILKQEMQNTNCCQKAGHILALKDVFTFSQVYLKMLKYLYAH